MRALYALSTVLLASACAPTGAADAPAVQERSSVTSRREQAPLHAALSARRKSPAPTEPCDAVARHEIRSEELDDPSPYRALRDIRLRYTRLPVTKGREVIAVTNARAVSTVGGEETPVAQPFAIIEDEQCFSSRAWASAGTFECYEINDGQPRYKYTIKDDATRAILSVAAFLANSRAVEDAAQRVASGSQTLVSLDGLYEATSAPDFIDAWYVCQSCKGSEHEPLNLKQDLSTARFGHNGTALFIETTKPRRVVARLRTGSMRADYFICPSN